MCGTQETPKLNMNRKLTAITPQVNGYSVVIVQEASVDGNPGAFLGCSVCTEDWYGDGPLLMLGEAMREYKRLTERAVALRHLPILNSFETPIDTAATSSPPTIA